MSERFPIKWLGSMLGLTLFIVAVFALRQYFLALNVQEIGFALKKVDQLHLSVAIALTVVDYALLTGYDFLALRYFRVKLTYWRLALTSFLCYAFGHNVGLSVLSGGSIRVRMYTSWGVSLKSVMQVIAFAIITYWTGFLTLSTVVFPLLPKHALRVFPYIRPLGWVSGALLLTYIIWSLKAKKSIFIRGWEFPPLAYRYTLAQIFLSTLELLTAAGVLYMILSHVIALSFPAFIGIFLLAQCSGLASQVPGGIGVFESVILLSVSRHAPVHDVLAGLVLYRIIYYIVPLLVAALLLGINEAVSTKFRRCED